MADAKHVAALKEGAAEWNRWRDTVQGRSVDLSSADLSGMKLNGFNLVNANLTGAILRRTQLERAHLKGADLTGAILDGINLEHANARDAIFNDVIGHKANFEVSTLRGARFRNARLTQARFHRAYLRDTDLTDAVITGAWLRFARLDSACCERTDFSGGDLRHASMVNTDLRGANLTDVHVFGISAWGVTTDPTTRQDMIVARGDSKRDQSLRAHDLQTAQLLALMLDAGGVRRVLDSVSSKMVLILGSFAPDEKVILDALRGALQGRGYVAVTFDFERPADRDYAETIQTLIGMCRFVVADFTNAKEVRAEVAQARRQYPRVAIIPIAKDGIDLPITMLNSFSVEELRLLVRYRAKADLLEQLESSIIQPAEAHAIQIAGQLAQAESVLRSTTTRLPGSN